ncbi:MULTISPECIES: hypothetical protein [unclassified Sinorhizobium]|uniref:hypothetical protein n=1 Tax=unclassified Sinorhizobium TaxID=2613772 RepID=UPI0035248148
MPARDFGAVAESAFPWRLLPLVILTALLLVGLDWVDGRAYLMDVDGALLAAEICRPLFWAFGNLDRVIADV